MKHLPIDQNMRWESSKIKPIFIFALFITLAVCCLAPQAQAGPAPIQTYFVPLPELQVQNSLNAVDTNNAIGNDMRTIISIAATGDSTIFYYDHWEDGYEADMANPVQASTEIWGDNDPLNGIPPGFATDLIDAGDIITLDNTVSLPRNPALIRYDGRDKFGGTKAVAVTRASWAVSPGVVLAGAVEVYPLRDYGLHFEVPVGEDLASDQMFQYVSLMVMAAADGTDIQIDIDGDGSTDISQTLNQGESYQVDGGIDTGASVIASNPVQAHIFTGDIGARYESRFYTLYPVDNWSDSYYSPVGTAADGDETYVFVYNPNGSAITVNYETRIGSGSFVVAAGGAYRYLMPSQSGAHFFTSDGSTFFAIATVGADPGANLVHDWGFSLLPENYLTPIAVVGWGPGSDDLSQNGSPVWVTAAAATTVYVDYDGDPTTGPLTDANGDQYDVALNLSMLESARVYDNSDNDQTGMRLYTLDGILITAAWGQDPANSLGGAPYLDLGTTVLPFPIASVEKTSAIVVDENSNGLIDWGDTLEYTIIVNNDGVIVLGGIVAFDGLPTGTEYVLGSTTLNGAPVADDTVPPAATEFPMDETGLPIPVIPPTEFSTITFRVTVNDGTTSITNSVRINTDQEELNTEDSIDVNTPDVTACSLEFSDDGGVSQATYLVNSDIYVTVDDNDQNTDAGSIQSFSVVVVNSDSGDTETITLTETGNDTGVFRNTAALPSSPTSGLSHEDGILYAAAGNTVQVAFRDPVFGDTCSDTAGIVISTEIKPLYLSEPGQGMDRVDPVATVDTTTSTLNFSTGGATSNTGQLAYADKNETSTNSDPRVRAWDGSSFGPEGSAQAVDKTPEFIVIKASPTTDEMIMGTLSSANSELHIQTRDSSGTWTWNWSTVVDYNGYRNFDIAYEQSSGDAIVVFGSSPSKDVKYRRRTGGTWDSSDQTLFTPGGSSGNWVRLEANPTNDDIFLGVLTTTPELYAYRWNGSTNTWGDSFSKSSSNIQEKDTESFDIAFETSSGEAFFIWGDKNYNINYRRFTTSWQTEQTAYSSVDGIVKWLKADYDPQAASSNIAIAAITQNQKIEFGAWNGSSWVTRPTPIVARSTIERGLDVAFEGSSSKAMYIFNQSATLYQMSWRTWTAAGGFSSVTTESGSTAEINFMQAHGYTNGNDIMAVYSDKNEDLYHRKWDGSSWTALDTALETEISRVNGKEPFMFAWQALTTSNSGTTSMAVWSAAGIPEYNAWDGSSFTTTLGAVTQTDRWRIMAGAAAPTRDEKIVVGIENSSNEISGELWNGSSWSKTSLTALANVSQSYWWGADVAYEQQSGDAVLVWTGGTTYTNQLRYQVWNGSSWTAPANIAAYTGSTPMQMQLAANPNSDEMVLVVNDSNENDYALVWDGSSWGNLSLWPPRPPMTAPIFLWPTSNKADGQW